MSLSLYVLIVAMLLTSVAQGLKEPTVIGHGGTLDGGLGQSGKGGKGVGGAGSDVQLSPAQLSGCNPPCPLNEFCDHNSLETPQCHRCDHAFDCYNNDMFPAGKRACYIRCVEGNAAPEVTAGGM